VVWSGSKSTIFNPLTRLAICLTVYSFPVSHFLLSLLVARVYSVEQWLSLLPGGAQYAAMGERSVHHSRALPLTPVYSVQGDLEAGAK
jgi:hypothetical protein